MAERRRLYEQLMSDLLDRILAGEYAPGDRVPREQDLAAAHGVSRNVARECILALKDRGVLSVKHGVGQTVMPVDRWNLLDPILLDALTRGSESAAVLAEAAEFRALLAPEVAALAARRRDDRHLARLADGAERSEEELDDALLAAAGNRFLRHVAGPLARALAGAGGAGREARARRVAVLEAVRAGDEDAAREAARRRLGHSAGRSRRGGPRPRRADRVA